MHDKLMTMARTTRAFPIVLALRRDILAGRLEPGAQLKFQSLVAEHDASVPVIREALTHLVERGLVESEPHYGYRVKQHSREDLIDLVYTRQLIEPMVLNDSVRHGDAQWEANLVGAHHLLAKTPESLTEDWDRTRDEWAISHASFHTALLAGAKGLRLQAYALRLRDEAEPLRRRSTISSQSHLRNTAAEHREIMELAVARKPEEAAEALRKHIINTAGQVFDADELDWFRRD